MWIISEQSWGEKVQNTIRDSGYVREREDINPYLGEWESSPVCSEIFVFLIESFVDAIEDFWGLIIYEVCVPHLIWDNMFSRVFTLCFCYLMSQVIDNHLIFVINHVGHTDVCLYNIFYILNWTEQWSLEIYTICHLINQAQSKISIKVHLIT